MARQDLSTFYKDEALFFLKTIDLEQLMLDEGFVKSKNGSTRKEPLYKKDGMQLGVALGHKGFPVWNDVTPGANHGNIKQTTLGFLQLSKGIDARESYNVARKICLDQYGPEYKMFVEQFAKVEGEASIPRYVRDLVGTLGNIKPRQSKAVPKVVLNESEPEVEKIFEFKPAHDFSLLIDRGLTVDTINHPIFKDCFGNASGTFAESSQYSPDKLVYENHLIIPYRNIKGEIVSLEAKNRFTEEGFAEQIERAIRQNENLGKVRRNPSKFYVDSSKSTSFGMANIPDNPDTIFLCEQPIDAMSYFQMNREASERTIFMFSGGNITDTFIQKVSSLLDQYKTIISVKTGFDNDISGLSYSLKLLSALPIHNEAGQKFQINWSRNTNNEIEIDFLAKSLTDQAIFKDLPATINSIRKEIHEKFKPEGKVEFYPSLTANLRFLTVAVKYTEANNKIIHDILSHYMASDNLFSSEVSAGYKDWNAQLTDDRSVPEIVYQHIIDMKSNRDRVFINENNEIVYQRRQTSPKSSVRDSIGKINPFALYNPVQAYKALLPDQHIKKILDDIRAEYRQLFPVLKEDFLSKATDSGVKYYPLTKEFGYKGKGAIANIKEGVLQFTGKDISEELKKAIKAMAAAIKANIDPEIQRFSINYNELFFSSRNNEGILYQPFKKTFVGNVILGVVTAEGFKVNPLDELIGDDQRKVDAVKAGLEKLKEDHANGRATDIKGEEFQIINGNLIWHTEIGELQENNIELKVAGLTERMIDVLDSMKQDLRAGRDPNKPGLVGRILPNFTFAWADGFDPSTLNDYHIYQFSRIVHQLADLHIKWRNLREKYTEPLYEIKSKDLTLYYRNEPLYQFVNGAIVPLLRKSEYFSRSFHPQFDKALQLFNENGGVIHNYFNDVRINVKTLDLYYNSPDYIIGKVFSHEGKYLYHLYNNVPALLRREMELLCSLPMASHDLVKELNLDMAIPKELNQVKERKVAWLDTVPIPYRRFFDIEKKKFVPIPGDKLKHQSPNFNTLYMNAFLWHLKSGGQGNENIQSRSKFIRKENQLWYTKHHQVAEYVPEKDMLNVIMKGVGVQFLPELAAFEKEHVKDVANRRYAEFLAEFDSTVKDVSVTAIEEFLQTVQQSSKNGHLTILNSRLEPVLMGYVKSGSLFLDSNLAEYSPVYKAAMEHYAKATHLKIQWVLIGEEQSQSSKKLTSIEISDVSSANKFDHKLRLTQDGILSSLVESSIFKDRISLTTANKVVFNFLPGENSILEFPFGGDWSSIKQKQIWLAGPTESGLADKLIIAQTPDQGALYAQFSMRETILNNTLYLSLLNYPGSKEREIIEKFVTKFKIKATRIVGDDAFISNLEGALKKAKIPVESSVSTLSTEQTHKKLKELLSPYEPSKDVQELLRGVQNHNIFNPSEGLAIFPVRSESLSHRVVLGADLTQSRDPDALFFSKPLKESKRIVLVSNVEEALHYMQMNKEFIDQTCVISFQNNVTAKQVTELNKVLSLPRFMNKIDVANSHGLLEQLGTHGFKMPTNTIIPHFKKTFKEEYVSDFKSKSFGNSSTSEYLKAKQMGKSMAPDKGVVVVQGPAVQDLGKTIQ